MDLHMILMICLLAMTFVLIVMLIAVLAKLSRYRKEIGREVDDRHTQLMNAQDTSGADLQQLGKNQQYIVGKLESLGQQMMMSASAQNDNLLRLDRRMEQMQAVSTGALQNIRQTNERQLNEMRHTVDEKLQESIDKRLQESFAQVSGRLEQVYRGLGEMQTLAKGVGDLKAILGNVKTRGIWGEVQLGALMEQLLAPGQYDENVAVVPGAAERVEFAVRLPGRHGEPVYLPVDSKFPQQDYQRLCDALQNGEKAAAEQARKAFARAVMTEGKRIAGKYIRPPHTTDFAVMFLPLESLYAQAARTNGLIEQLQRDYRIVVAGPTTFAALLNSLQMGFRTLAIQQRTGQVWQMLGQVRNDFGAFADVLEKTQQRLRQASESIDTAFRKTRTIRSRLDGMELPESASQSGNIWDEGEES